MLLKILKKIDMILYYLVKIYFIKKDEHTKVPCFKPNSNSSIYVNANFIKVKIIF